MREVPLVKALNVPDSEQPDQRVLDNERHRALTWELEEALAHLPDEEARVVRMSFGLEGLDPTPLSYIAQHLNTSPAWAEEVRERALRHLRDYFTVHQSREWFGLIH